MFELLKTELSNLPYTFEAHNNFHRKLKNLVYNPKKERSISKLCYQALLDNIKARKTVIKNNYIEFDNIHLNDFSNDTALYNVENFKSKTIIVDGVLYSVGDNWKLNK